MTPDNKTLIVNIQHPGEGGTISKLTSHWPARRTPGARRARVRDDLHHEGRRRGDRRLMLDELPDA